MNRASQRSPRIALATAAMAAATCRNEVTIPPGRGCGLWSIRLSVLFEPLRVIGGMRPRSRDTVF
jgi:hypothetical protein